MNYLDFISNNDTRFKLKQAFIKEGFLNGNKLCEKTPKRLFRYSSLDKYVINDLKRGELTLSNPTIFNDTYDSYLHRDSSDSLILLENDLKETLSYFRIDYTIPSKEKLLEKAKQEDDFLTHYLTETMVIGCVSEALDSILMWSHYSDKNRGICIEYDFTNSAINPYLYPVVYTSKPFDCTKLSVPDYEEFDIDLATILSVVNKSDLWSYEKEWRIILYFGGKKFLRVPVLVPKPTAIYLGTAFIQAYHESKIKNEYQSFFEYINDNNIPLYKMSSKNLSYELEYSPFNLKELNKH